MSPSTGPRRRARHRLRLCTNAFPNLVGELFLSTPSSTNLQTATLDGPASFTAWLDGAADDVSKCLMARGPSAPLLRSCLRRRRWSGGRAGRERGTLAAVVLSNVGGGTHALRRNTREMRTTRPRCCSSCSGECKRLSSSPRRPRRRFHRRQTGDALTEATVTGSRGRADRDGQFESQGTLLGTASLTGGMATLMLAQLALAPGSTRWWPPIPAMQPMTL